MARILGVSGSPHSDGNTAFAVHYALEYLSAKQQETRYLSLSGREVRPCVGCFRCSEDGACAFDDGMSEVYEAMRWCDALVLGSPVYMGMVSGQTKTMMDRCVAFRPSYEKGLELDGKIGCGIACGGFRNGGQETTLQNIHTFLLQQAMKAINDGFPYSHAGAAIAGVASEDELGLGTIRNMMENLLKALRWRSPDGDR
jgi:multimeric flavodoxin WrbA